MQKTKAGNAKAKAIWWSYQPNNDGKCPIKIRVTYKSERRYYPVEYTEEKEVNGKTEKVTSNLFMSKGEWLKIAGHVKGENLAKKNAVVDAESRARAAINKIKNSESPQFTFDRFKKKYLIQDSDAKFLGIFRRHLKDVLEAGQIGTYQSYQSAYTAFNKFRGAVYDKKGKQIKAGKDIAPADITLSLLKKFEAHLSPAKRSTIGIYMRALRVVYNVAIADDSSLAEFYPFAKKAKEKGKYVIKKGSGKKGDALSVEDLRKFISIETEPDSPEREAKLIWLFSFHCQGMNMADIASLQYVNTEGPTIQYVRKKTKDTETEETPIEIPMTDSIAAIIRELGNPDKRKTAYVFGYINSRMDGLQQKATIKGKTKTINKWLKRIAAANGLPPITTYWARHSYANLLKQSGTSIDVIRELLGHGDVRTTEAYLKRFDIDVKREANQKVFSIINKKSA